MLLNTEDAINADMIDDEVSNRKNQVCSYQLNYQCLNYHSKSYV